MYDDQYILLILAHCWMDQYDFWSSSLISCFSCVILFKVLRVNCRMNDWMPYSIQWIIIDLWLCVNTVKCYFMAHLGDVIFHEYDLYGQLWAILTIVIVSCIQLNILVLSLLFKYQHSNNWWFQSITKIWIDKMLCFPF